jgi:hypothetical protein
MPEPVTISLAAVGTVALTEGVKFLYGQAAELLKRWRERRDATKTTPSQAAESAVVELPADVFEGQLSAPQIHYDKLTQVEPRLKELVRKIVPYQIDPESIDAKDENLLKAIDGLRRTLEVIYQQRLTFKGETGRPASGPFIDIEGEVEVEHALGDVAGVRIDKLTEGTVRGKATVKTADKGSIISGTYVKEAGRKSSDPEP